MPRHLQAIDNITGKPRPHGISIEGKPDTCPRCHQGIAAKETSVATLNGDPLAQGTVLEVVYQCPLQRCAKLFVAAYRRSFTMGRPTSGDVFNLVGVLPTTPKAAAVSSEVSEVSPTFTLIYNQAVAAEAYGLDQIAGVGLRKALEFLIKDYCIHLKPEDAHAVRKEFLGRTIQNRVTDAKVITSGGGSIKTSATSRPSSSSRWPGFGATCSRPSTLQQCRSQQSRSASRNAPCSTIA
jgi:hypothetical protein